MNWLLVALGLVLAPFTVYLSPWVVALAAALGLWRYAIVRQLSPQPGQLILLPIVAASVVGILATYGGITGRDAGVALLVLMTALKTMEAKSARDMRLVVYLGYFLSVCTFLFSQAIPLALFMLLSLATLTATLAALSYPQGELPPRRLANIAGIMLAQALPVMLVLFVLFPRIANPLWATPQDAERGMTGLSDDMSPGSISNLSRSDAPAFRAVFHGAIPPASQLYWRGPVFWDYDGRTWRANQPPQPAGKLQFQAHAAPVQYTVTLEPHNKPWLFVLDLPVKLPDIGFMTEDFQLQSRQPVRTRIRYAAASSTAFQYGLTLTAGDRARALRLPPFGNQRTRSLAAQWREENPAPAALVQKALAMYHADFTYTLNPPPLGSSAVDGFLFDTKKGFCEHYAGSFVFLMRAAGVPARVVTGYQGGQANPLGDYLIVRQSDAHAWAEVWLDGKGWVRIDPTAAVAPERIEQGIAAALPAADLPAMARLELTWVKRLSLSWDVVNNGWNQWIIGYNQQRQMEFLARLVGAKPDWGDLTLWMTGLVSLIVGIIAAVMLRNANRETDPAQILWNRYKRKLARAGVAILPHEGPRDLTRRAARQLPDLRDHIERIGELYMGLRYGGEIGTTELQRLVREFRP